MKIVVVIFSRNKILNAMQTIKSMRLINVYKKINKKIVNFVTIIMKKIKRYKSIKLASIFNQLQYFLTKKVNKTKINIKTKAKRIKSLRK